MNVKGTELTLGMLLHRHCQPCSQNLFLCLYCNNSGSATSGPAADLHASVPEGRHASNPAAGLRASAHDASAAVVAEPVRNTPSDPVLHHDNDDPTSLADASRHHPSNTRGHHGHRYAVTAPAY